MQNKRDDDFLLGQVKVCPAQNTLSLGGQELSIQPRVMDVLCYLAKYQDRVVSLDELIENLWNGSVVSNHSVHRCISSIRKHFTELLGEGEYVKSFTKKGYQLCVASAAPAERPNASSLENEQNDGALIGNISARVSSKFKHFALPLLVVITLAIIALVLIGKTSLFSLKQSAPVQPFQFNKVISLTSEPGLEFYPEPHPDNRHFAYAKLRNDSYQLFVRDFDGNEWMLDESPGKWDMFAWSPDGSQLIASSANFSHNGTKVDIYLFELDIEHQSIVKKSLIIPWDGDVYSVTWRDDVTLEMTARYGVRGEYSRFSYLIPADKLEKMERFDESKAPHIVDIHEKKTAIASHHKGGMAIDIFDEAGNTLVSTFLKPSWIDISWSPKGDGLLILNLQKLCFLNLAGELQEIPYMTDDSMHRPRFSADGKNILFGQLSENFDVWLLDLNGQKKRLTEHLQNDSLGRFSPSGDTIYYRSNRQGADQIRAIENGKDRLVTKSKDQHIIWYIVAKDSAFIIYKTEVGIYRFNIQTQEHQLIFKDEGQHFPLAYFSKKDLLYYASHEPENTNIWRINLSTLDKKQITFGTVYGAVAIESDIYFQYFNKSGLYRLGIDEKIPQLLTESLPANSIYTMFDNKGVYYMMMEYQQQSDNYYLDFATGKTSTFLQRGEDKGAATSFHPKHGLLLQMDEEENGNIVRLIKR